MRFGKLKSAANNFLAKYKAETPATYAAAQQAVGGILILDGFIGIDNPFGGRKRSGIFGALIGMVVGVLIIFGSGFITNLTGTKELTAQATATVVSVSQSQSSASNNANSSGADAGACYLVAKYTVDGKEYSQNSVFGSSAACGLTAGQTIDIKYNPESPGAWGYGVDDVNIVLKAFPLFGVLIFVISFFTFVIRLVSILFGWKLLKSGRALAKTLPDGGNLESVIAEIKQNFSSLLFAGNAPTQMGAAAASPTAPAPAQTPVTPPPAAPVEPTEPTTPPSDD